MGENTNHLQLYKANPETDGNDYFDINRMLNDNWDKIDESIQEDRSRMSEIEQEIHTPEYKTIQPTTDSIIDLGENIVKGQVCPTISARTYTNLLGDDGAGFSSGNTGVWTARNGTTVINGTRSIMSSNSVRISSFGASRYAGTETPEKYPIITGHEYFVSMSYYTNHNNLRTFLSGCLESFALPYTSQIQRTGGIFTATITDDSKISVSQDVVEPDKIAEIDGIMMIDLTVLGETERDIKKLIEKYHYINQTKSTLSTRIKSIGKNKVPFNEDIIYDAIKKDGYYYKNNSTDFSSSKRIYLEKGKTYTFSAIGHVPSQTSDSRFLRLGQYDENNPSKFIRLISTLDFSSIDSDTKISKNITINYDGYYSLYMIASNGELFVKDISIVPIGEDEEPYKESIQHMQLPNKMEMHSLENRVKDEVCEENGKWYLNKRTTNDILNENKNWNFNKEKDGSYIFTIKDFYPISSTGVSFYAWNNDSIITKENYTSSTQIGIVITWGDTLLYLSIPKENSFGITSDVRTLKNYLKNKPITLIYQLAEPKIYEDGENGFSITGSLESFGEGTTIQIDAYLKKSYTIENTIITLDYPISSIDSLQKFVNGTWIDATGTLSTDGKTITVSNEGTYKVECVIRSEEHAGQEITLNIPVNQASRIESIEDLTIRNANSILDLWGTTLALADEQLKAEIEIDTKLDKSDFTATNIKNMITTVDGRGSNIDTDLWRGWKIYDSISLLGITIGSSNENINNIVEHMSNKSILITGIGGSNRRNDYPNQLYGVLKIIKIDNSRTNLEYTVNESNRKFYGIYYYVNPQSQKFTGWREVVTTEDTKGWRIYDNLSQLGINIGSETMKGIADSMANRSIAILDVHATVNNVSSYPVGSTRAYGNLKVTKYSIERCIFEFTDDVTTRTWKGIYNHAIGFVGWDEVVKAEFGENSNGAYIKYSNGFLKMWSTITVDNKESFFWVFPVSISKNRNKYINARALCDLDKPPLIRNVTNTSTEVKLSNIVDRVVDVSFTGYWK